MTAERLERLKAKLQALRAKTVANGCTEAEALAAAAKVAELLDRHDLALADLEIRAGQCVSVAVEPPRKQRQPMAACVGAVAAYCDCLAWREKDADGRIRHVFFGLPASTEMALCIHDLIAAALQTAWDEYAHRQRFIRHGADEKGSFLLGMAVAIADRLAAMKAERDAAHRGGGRDLVVARRGVVEAEFARLGLALRQGGASGKAVAAAAFEAGHGAGRAVTLDPAGGGPPRRRPGS